MHTKGCFSFSKWSIGFIFPSKILNISQLQVASLAGVGPTSLRSGTLEEGEGRGGERREREGGLRRRGGKGEPAAKPLFFSLLAGTSARVFLLVKMARKK